MNPPSREAEGLVLRVDAKVCHVEVDGQKLVVPLRGRLFEEPTHESRPVAVGDRVVVEVSEGAWALESVLPRTSQLSRTRFTQEQVLAANISLVLVVASVREPLFQAGLVDHVLAGAEREEIPAAVVITKVDRERKGEAETWTALYESLGYRVFPTSIESGRRTEAVLESLAETLHRNLTVLCGPSGVGKSALINELIPGLGLKVGSIGRVRQGKHTTTHTQLVPLPGGGHVLDTPGIRNFGLFGLKAGEVPFLFRELKARSGACEFRDCTHRHEPGCAVLPALERGEIASSRYESYMLMLADAERNAGPSAFR